MGRGFARREGGGGGGSANVGALLRQAGNNALGLFIGHRGADESWHLRGVEREDSEPSVASTVRIAHDTSNYLDLTFADAGDTTHKAFTPIDGNTRRDLPEQVNAYTITTLEWAAPADAINAEADYRLWAGSPSAGIDGGNIRITSPDASGGAGTPTNSGLIRVIAGNPSRTLEGATVDVNVAGDGDTPVIVSLTLTGTSRGAAGNDISVVVHYESGHGDNSIFARGSADGDEITISIKGTASLGDLLTELGRSPIHQSNGDLSTIFVSGAITSNAGSVTSVTWDSDDADRTYSFAGGQDGGREPLSAVWDADAQTLTVTAIATDTANEVITAITALDDFQAVNSRGAGNVRLQGAAVGGNVIRVSGTVGGSISYGFSGGRNAVLRQNPVVAMTQSGENIPIGYRVRYHGANTPAGQRTTLAEMKAAWDRIPTRAGISPNSPQTAITGTGTEVVVTIPSSPSGGEDFEPAGAIEAIAHPEEDQPNVEVRYDATEDTLQEIHDALEAQGIVTVVGVYGSDLTASPENPPFTRTMFLASGVSTGISGVTVQDEGTALSTPATTLNFEGTGVEATGAGATKTITITGGSGGGISGIEVKDEGTALTTDATGLNFAGAGVTATGNGAEKTVTIPGGISGVEIKDEGTALSTDATGLNFTGTGVTVTGNGAEKTVTIPGDEFDLHDDVSTAATSINSNALDRFLISQESVAGDPNAYITAANVRTFMKGYVGTWTGRPGGFVFRKGDITDHSSRWYITTTQHTKQANGPDSDSTNFVSITSWGGAWATGFFQPGIFVTHASNVYVSIQDILNTDPAPNDAANTKWVQINGGGSTGISGITIEDEGTALSTAATTLDFVGPGVTVTGNTDEKTITIPGGGISGITVEDESTALTTAATTLDFVGTGVTVTGNAAKKTITIPGASGGTTVVANPDGTADGGNLTKVTIGGTIYAIPAGGGDDSGGGPFATEIGRKAFTAAEIAGTSRGYDTGLNIPASVGADEWWGVQFLTETEDSLHLFKASHLTGATNVTIAAVGGQNPTSYDGPKFQIFVNSADYTVSLGRTAAGDITFSTSFRNNTFTPTVVLYRMGTGGTEVEANPSGAVDSGALTKLDVDGSIYSVGTGSGGIAGVTIEDEGTALTTAATTIDFTGAGVTATGSGATKIVNIPGDGDLSNLKSDTLVFYAPTSGHAAFDALDYGSTVTIVHGSSQTDATVWSASRSGTVCTLVLAPTDDWTAIFTQATFQLQDDTDPTPNTITTLTVASRVNARSDVDSPGEFFAGLDALTGGDEVWRDIARIDADDNTHLTLGTRTATTVPINSSTGDPVTIPVATTALAGAESAADKTQLTALPPTWVGGRVWPAGSQVAYQERIYRATTQREVADTDPPTTDPAWVDVALSGETNLSVATSSTQVTIESDTGTNAVISPATDSVAGAYPASAHERVEASIDKWADGAHTVGQQRVWNETAYICIADTSPGDGNPATDTTGWAPLASAPDLSGYATTAAIANFQTATEITTEIGTAVADRLIDGGSYDSTSAYTARTIVRNDGASYLSLIAVAANTGATTEPGVGTAWETSWYRIGYEDGPPNAFINAALAGDNLTFTREGGTNPLSVDIGGVSGGSTVQAESIGVTANLTVAAQSWEKIVAFDAAPVVRYPDGLAAEIITRDDAHTLTLAPGVYVVNFEGTIDANADRAAPVFKIQQNDGTAVYAQSDKDYDRNNSSSTDLAPNTPLHFSLTAFYIATAEQEVEIYAGSDPDLTGIGGNNTSGQEYILLDDEFRITFIRPGSGNPIVNNVFNPVDLGTDTFDLNGSATQVALTDDTSGNAIVIPNAGYILTIATVPGLGIRGQVQLHLAEDLQAATMEDGLTAQFYTNTDNELIFGAGPQTGGTATVGNKIIVQRVGSTTDTSSGGTTVINPSILRFDVTGENHPSVADISGDVFNVVGEISQSGHVGSADIVGFAGTSHDPSSVSTLLSNTQITAAGGYHHFTGRLTIPAGTSLTNVGDIYTIRLRVWPTGGDTSTAPTIYHDYRITRVAAAAVTHFGDMPFFQSDGSTHTDASDLTSFANDISTAGSALGDWTVSGLTDAGERRLYWAVPATDTQPAVWINSGSDVTSIIDVPSAAQNIGTPAVSYRVYVTNRQFDDFANGITYTTRSS